VCLARRGEKAGRTFLIEQAKLVVSDVRGQVVAGAGHWLMEETPGTVNEILLPHDSRLVTLSPRSIPAGGS
jgi:pimeloyl-ACP methyl ester carboxylesterase